ncbi:tRNA pseudouridine(55) synthase TruB [Flammeovirgaceae bacterium KN852]|uniref:tRNA pseudouridine synthase B n=1 Tax=Marinigracilibium pacificum TaxID=2729599 RepID=A0A848IU29_9BACT|nr:tRNA pseudouridine(55) synthase TruB [Marinigracilibium pacificum]
MLTPYFDNGQVICIDKPYEWTSFDVIKKIRFGLKIKKVGHAGTLDPLATGLLVICTGKKTKEIENYQAAEKEYICDLVLGKTTPSVDLETDFDSETNTDHLTNEEITKVINSFQGEIDQVPPIFSAIKVDGERVYEKARKGETVELKSRKIQIHEIEILESNNPEIKIRIVCSKGTYIRSLVRDIGEKLQVGAYMKALVRTRIGELTLENALSPEEYVEKNKFRVAFPENK